MEQKWWLYHAPLELALELFEQDHFDWPNTDIGPRCEVVVDHMSGLGQRARHAALVFEMNFGIVFGRS